MDGNLDGTQEKVGRKRQEERASRRRWPALCQDFGYKMPLLF